MTQWQILNCRQIRTLMEMPEMSSSFSQSELAPEPSENPRNWRFTWECQSHVPTLKLYLFQPTFNPESHCRNLKVDVIVEQSLLIVSFIEFEADETSLRVPLPKALIDSEAPVHFRAHNDHIEVKLLLLLPIDHPLVSEFDFLSDVFRSLSAASDVKKLSALDEVYFYCRSCSTKLTRPLRVFKEVPSVNWQDVADNWFGNCCCSFGGISDKLVMAYVKSYACAAGVCLLDTTSVILSKDDLVKSEFSTQNGNLNSIRELNFLDGSWSKSASVDDEIKQGLRGCVENGAARGQVADGKDFLICLNEDNLKTNKDNEENNKKIDSHSPCCLPTPSEMAENIENMLQLSTGIKHELEYSAPCCNLHPFETNLKQQQSGSGNELLSHQKLLLNGFLENGFMARSSSLSKDVQWVESWCPQCSCLVGAYPCLDDLVPLDGGIRLFKSQISTSLPSLESNDVFSSYSLDRVFASQLVESAKDELSFRTVVRDMQTGHPMLQLVLLNPDSWCYSGRCSTSQGSAARINLYPNVKVLFASCYSDKGVVSREVEEWSSKNEVDAIYMLPSLIKELVRSLESANSIYPPSQKTLQGLLLSSMRR